MIPKVLHRIWVGGALPSEFRAFGETWREHHPDWEHQLWTDSTLPPVLSRESARLYELAEKYAPNHVGQFRADIGRYELLLKYGGVYVDTDFECRKPLDELIEELECFAAWESSGRWIGNAIMGAVPGQRFISELVGRLPANVRAFLDTQRPNKMTGPQYLTQLYRAAPLGMTVLAKELFYPYLYNELGRRSEAFPEAYAVHHWANARKRLVTA